MGGGYVAPLIDVPLNASTTIDATIGKTIPTTDGTLVDDSGIQSEDPNDDVV